MTEANRIDEISAAIGRIDGYVHEYRHSSANLEQKFDALPTLIRKENEKLEEKVTSMLREHSRDMENRLMRETSNLRDHVTGVEQKVATLQTTVNDLQASDHRREGALSLGSALLQSRALGWFVGAAITAWAILSGKVHL